MEQRKAEAGKPKPDQALLNRLWAITNDTLLQKMPVVGEQRESIIAAAEQRYIDALKDDPAAVLRDVEEIVAAVTKDEYIADQKRINEILSPLDTIEDKQARKTSQKLKTQGFANCYRFIMRHIRVQLNALVEDADTTARALDVVERQAALFYKKPKSFQPSEPEELPAELATASSPEIEKTFFWIPNSPVTDIMSALLNYGGDFRDIPRRWHGFNGNVQLEAKASKKERALSYTRNNETFTVTLTGEEFEKNPYADKLFTFLLQKAGECAIYKAKLVRDTFEFNLRELITCGIYRNMETARQGCNTAFKVLKTIGFSGTVYVGKGTKQRSIKQATHINLFSTLNVAEGIGYVRLNPDVNWAAIAPFWAALPNYYYRLPARSAILLKYIFSLARQHTKDIAGNGCFTISFRAIHARLNLPELGATKNPGRDIKDAIDDAITDIEDEERKRRDQAVKSDDPDFHMEICPDGIEAAPVRDYLENGYLKITIKGEYAKPLADLHEKAQAKIEAAEKHLQQIKDQALIKKAEKEL